MCCGHKHGHRLFWGAPLVLFFIAMGSLLTMLLWNSLLPDIFGIKAISYLQAVGLLVLSKILFGSFGRSHRYFYNRHMLKKKCECECESETPAGQDTKA